jgi:hypothetical protein
VLRMPINRFSGYRLRYLWFRKCEEHPNTEAASFRPFTRMLANIIAINNHEFIIPIEEDVLGIPSYQSSSDKMRCLCELRHWADIGCWAWSVCGGFHYVAEQAEGR